jgi:hypothetical protein
MSNKYDHDLAAEVLRAAGVRFPEYRSLYGPLSSNDHLTAEQLIELSQQEKQVSEWRRRIRERLPIGMSRTTSRTTSFPSSTPLFF